MPAKKTILPKNFFKEIKGAKKVAIVGVGNPLKADDGLGAICTEHIYHELRKSPNEKIMCIIAGEVPENFTGKIRSHQPSHVIIIDAVQTNDKPGTVTIIDEKKIKDEAVSTHRLSLGQFVRYIKESIGAQVIIIGVVPKSLDWGTPISPPVKKAINALARALIQTLSRILKNRQ
ncbi:MAG: hydrogenase maturation peptidase HycI [candidate division WOR-3 bacterium]